MPVGGKGSDDVSPAVSMILGGAAGSLAEVTVMPALVVRTRMMVQGADKSITQYSSFGNAMSTMIRKEGIGSFYKGMSLNMAFTPLARGMFMTGADVTKSVLGDDTPLKNFAAGMNGQLFASIAYVPRDVIVERCAINGQLATEVGSTSSSLAALRTVFSNEGWYGFYRAFIPHQLVWVPFNGLFFAALGKCNEVEKEAGIDTNNYALGVANTFVAAAFAAVCTNPIDVIKTRLQVAGANPEVFSYSGPLDCILKLMRSEGPSALFAGLVGRFM